MKPYNTNRIQYIPSYRQIVAAEALVKLKHAKLPKDAYEIHNRIKCSVARDMRSGGMKRCMQFNDLTKLEGE